MWHTQRVAVLLWHSPAISSHTSLLALREQVPPPTCISLISMFSSFFFFFHIPLSLFYSLVLFTHLFSCLSTHNCILLFFSPPLHAPPRNQVFHTMWPSMVLTGIKWAMQGAAGRGRGATSPVSPDPADNRGEHRLPLRRPTGTFGSHSLAQRHSMQFPKFRDAIGSTCVHGSHKKDWKKLFYLSC